MESMIEFLGLMTITALSASLALLLEWLLLSVVFRAFRRSRQAAGNPITRPRPAAGQGE